MRRRDLRLARPQILEEHRLALAAAADRLARDVELDAAGEAEGDHERRRGQEGVVEQRVDAAREVAVAGEHRRRDHAPLLDGLGHHRHQRAGVADAGGAAEADDAEAERFQIGEQTAALEIARGRRRARRQGGLHPGRRRQPVLAGLAGEQARGEQHPGVAGVGAACDRGDGDRTVAGTRRHRGEPRRRSSGRASRPTSLIRSSSASVGPRIANAVRAGSRRSCGRRGPGERELDPGEVDLDHGGVARRDVRVVPEALVAGIGLDVRQLARGRGRWRGDSRSPDRRVGKKPVVAPYSGAMLAIGPRSPTPRLATPGPKNSTNLPTTPSSRSRWVTVSASRCRARPGAGCR